MSFLFNHSKVRLIFVSILYGLEVQVFPAFFILLFLAALCIHPSLGNNSQSLTFPQLSKLTVFCYSCCIMASFQPDFKGLSEESWSLHFYVPTRTVSQFLYAVGTQPMSFFFQ